MESLIGLAAVIAGVAILVGGVFLQCPPLSSETREARIWNCVSIGSAFALMHFTNSLNEVLDAGPVAKPMEWAFVLLLAALFVYNALLEVGSWFGALRRNL
jgi:hypothetical protein